MNCVHRVRYSVLPLFIYGIGNKWVGFDVTACSIVIRCLLEFRQFQTLVPMLLIRTSWIIKFHFAHSVLGISQIDLEMQGSQTLPDADYRYKSVWMGYSLDCTVVLI